MRNGPPKAALVDELSLTYPDSDFIQNLTASFARAGYSFDYYGPDKFTVDMFQNLPVQGYSVLIIRAHTAGPTIITSEPYSTSKYVYQQLVGQVGAAKISNQQAYFTISTEFVRQALHGKFHHATVILMGCSEAGQRQAFANAFVERGARYLVGWDSSVSGTYTDTSTATVVSALIQGKTIEASVGLIAEPDPTYHGRLGLIDWKTVAQQRISVLFQDIALISAIAVLLVFGPMVVFVVPRIAGSFPHPKIGRKHRPSK